MIDICIPAGNEKELLEKAGQLGYQGVVFLYQFKTNSEVQKKKNELKNFKNVFVGTYVNAKSVSDVRKLENLYKDSDLIAVSCQTEELARLASECRFVDIIFEITLPTGKDGLKYRYSNFNAIIANMMKEHKQSYGVSFSHILAFEGKQRVKILGREMQNVYLCRRKIPIVVASFASKPEHMRLAENLSAVGRVLGLNYPQSKDAISTAIENILKRKEAMRDKNYVRAGVRIVG